MPQEETAPPPKVRRDAVFYLRWAIGLLLGVVIAATVGTLVFPGMARVAVSASLVAAGVLLVGSMILWRGEGLPGEAQGHRPAEAAALPAFGALIVVAGLLVAQCWRVEATGMPWSTVFPSWFLGS